ncbi:hypothetical protein CFter6_5244 [Collimonas fungivorans]|uniref:Uncharacterized protein n=1 Tax=Collimonas fungivorans TaxID=158899 RepID=A0A127PK76_9BURK|nr:hypothetical protein CFter6_5244 [Collimonas fungivorans]
MIIVMSLPIKQAGRKMAALSPIFSINTLNAELAREVRHIHIAAAVNHR